MERGPGATGDAGGAGQDDAAATPMSPGAHFVPNLLLMLTEGLVFRRV
jgi:hypothetical protein